MAASLATPSPAGVSPPKSVTADSGGRPFAGRASALWTAAQKIETSFLAEMLKHSGVGKPLKSFGGGPGEDAFSSFLVDAYAEKLTAVGGIGLADQIYRRLAADAGPADG